MKRKRHRICIVLMMCVLLNGCSLPGTEHTSAEAEKTSIEETSTEETSETTTKKDTEKDTKKDTKKDTEKDTEKTTEAPMTKGNFADTTLKAYIGQDIDDVIRDMGTPDMDDRSSSGHYWTQKVLYNQDSDDQIWFEFWYGEDDADPKFGRVYFVCAQAGKFFDLRGNSMDVETFMKNQNIKEYHVEIPDEEYFYGDSYTTIGDIGEEILLYMDDDGFGYQVVLNDHSITPDSAVGVTDYRDSETEVSTTTLSAQ